MSAPRKEVPGLADSTGSIPVRATSLTVAEPVAPEIAVGARVTLTTRVTDAEASDLRGGKVELLGADAAVVTRAIASFHNGVNETDPFAVTAPAFVGAFTWTLRFPRQDIGGTAYGESALAISLSTQPLRTSLAVWAVPSPVIVGAPFSVTVGAKSSGGCPLAGARVAILDQAGDPVGEGTLGEAPWPGTEALYWTEIAHNAPSENGFFSWSAAFAADGVALPHLGATAAFSFAAVKRPERCLTVKVLADDAPVEKVELALGPYRTATDQDGVAVIAAPAGAYELVAWHAEYEPLVQPIEIAQDCAVAIMLTRRPEELTAWG
jgi:hypothetical protein